MRDQPHHLPRKKLCDADAHKQNQRPKRGGLRRPVGSAPNHQRDDKRDVCQKVIPRAKRTEMVQMDQQPEEPERQERGDAKPKCEGADDVMPVSLAQAPAGHPPNQTTKEKTEGEDCVWNIEGPRLGRHQDLVAIDGSGPGT